MKKFLVVLLVIICIGLGAGVVFLRGSEDNEGPKITFEEGKDTKYSSDMTKDELLQKVKAYDEKDGDVTDSLTVETMYPKNDGKEMTIIFVAKDKSNNVTKKEFTMEASDGNAENPDLGLIDPDAVDEDAATDSTEADSTDSQDVVVADSADTASADTQNGEESLEAQAQKTQEDKIAQLSPQDPKMYLNTYYVEVPVGTVLDKLSYVKDIQDDVDTTSDLFKKIQITGDVNTGAAGTYELTYYVVDSNGNSSNGAVLTVVVK